MQRPQSDLCADEILTRDPDFRPHLDAIGLKTIEEYVAWCGRKGFSARLKKHWRERCRERFVASQDLCERRQTLARQQKRKPRKTLERLFAGELSEDDLRQPLLRLIHNLLISLDSAQTREAFKQVLLHAQTSSSLVSVQPGLPQLGMQPGNTFVEGMLALAGARKRWIRELTAWQPNSHNVRRQFSSLAAHLLARYPAPAFMDSAWLRGSSDNAVKQQEWYLALAAGQSPRELDLWIPLTKKMAHFFQKAPKDFLVEAALRWGQVLGLGGDSRLAKAILASRLGAYFENNEFWLTVIRWLVDQRMLDTVQVGPIIDYIYHQKFEPQLAAARFGDGEVRVQPAKPDFTLQGRTPLSLLAQMRDWHVSLQKTTQKPDISWPSSAIAQFELSEGTLTSGTLRKWTITELLSRRELFQEGQVMRHCVASYDTSCALGGSSIWSMRMERNHGRPKRVLTIEVASHRRVICQIRGKTNRLPNPKELDIIRRWASREQLVIDSRIIP